MLLESRESQSILHPLPHEGGGRISDSVMRDRVRGMVATMRKLIGLFMIALSAIIVTGRSVRAEEHLQPEGSVLGGSAVSPYYDIMVADAFRDAYAPGVKLRAIIEPSFAPEEAVYLVQDGSQYQLATLKPAIQFWSYESLDMMKRGEVLKIEGNDFEHGVEPDKEIEELQKALPKDFHDVKISRCTAPVETGLAKRIIAAWHAVLLETRFAQSGDKQVVVSDGVQIHFADSAEYPPLSGWTDWASENSKPYLLWELALAMQDYCDKQDASALERATAALEARIAAKDEEQ